MRKRTGYLPAAGSAGSFFEKYVEKWDGLKNVVYFARKSEGKSVIFMRKLARM